MGSNCSTTTEDQVVAEENPPSFPKRKRRRSRSSSRSSEMSTKDEKFALNHILYNLHRISKAQDYTTRKAILSSLFDLYKIYVLSATRYCDISYIMEPRIFFISLATRLHEESIVLSEINESILLRVLKDLSQHVATTAHEDKYDVDISELLRFNYGLLAQEEEIFGFVITNQLRYNYPKENLYGLLPNQLARNIELAIGPDTEDEQFLLIKEELYDLLSKTVIDSRSFDSPRFFDVMKSYKLKNMGLLSPNMSHR